MSRRRAEEPVAGREATPGEPDAPGGLGGFVLGNAVVVVSLVGGLAYVAVSVGQAAFYDRFGVDAAEVGLGYADTLTRGGRVLLPVVVLALFIFAMIAGRFSLPRIEGAGLVALLVLLMFSLLVYVTIGLPVQYARKADAVARGKELRPEIDRLLAVVLNPLGIRAERVRIEWTRREGEQPYRFSSTEVIYLGRADGVAVLFDVVAKRTVRVPDSEVIIVRESPEDQ